MISTLLRKNGLQNTKTVYRMDIRVYHFLIKFYPNKDNFAKKSSKTKFEKSKRQFSCVIKNFFVVIFLGIKLR